MGRARSISVTCKRSAFALGCLCLIGYFGYHAVHGDYGLIAWYRLQHEAAAVESELAGLRARREALERKVSLLRPDSLDPDMLDERAREALNFAHRDDITILRKSR